MERFTNSLINETSPYLLQHAHNPVNWRAWTDNSWSAASAANKLVIVSIGYSACHWCHVMEHESFEDEEVAKIMNDNFVCIKVDREERPDVDQIYMDAVQLITGRGGWPLNAITLPDGRPVYAGTYFPKEQWMQLLQYFVHYWNNNREEAMERATQITRGIKQMDVIMPTEQSPLIDSSLRPILFTKIDSAWDYEKGGLSGAPKFPMPVTLQFLLQHYQYTGNAKALDAATVTLNAMMNGGIYDHVGGGFSRYSVDAEWIIPHFEKMLYDNAQLVSVYANGYSVAPNERYKEVVYETLNFMDTELSDKGEGFYSAVDADSEGEEGKYYVWTADELKQILKNDYSEFAKLFEVTERGNFEGANNLTRKVSDSVHTTKLGVWRNALYSERNTRIAPQIDDKVLTSWNALAIKAYLDAYAVFGEQAFLLRALRCAQFIETNMLKPNYSLLRNYKNGNVTISGFLDDYSFVCSAFVRLYQITLNEHWLQQAYHIAEYVIQHFYNVTNGLFFYTSITDTPLIARKTELIDNVIPSSNSVMMQVLFYLGTVLHKPSYLQMAKQGVRNMIPSIKGQPVFHANWAMLLDWVIDSPFEIAISGNNALDMMAELNKHYLPNCLLMGANKPDTVVPLLNNKYTADSTFIYVCKDKVCSLPFDTVQNALKYIQDLKKAK